jgi:hypothetical protein
MLSSHVRTESELTAWIARSCFDTLLEDQATFSPLQICILN